MESVYKPAQGNHTGLPLQTTSLAGVLGEASIGPEGFLGLEGAIRA